MDKKSSLTQPLSLRRDYDDVEGAMIKPLPPTPPPTPEEALKENIIEMIPSVPQGQMDYDDPTPMPIGDKGCGGPMHRGGPGGPMNKSMNIECPVCNNTNKYIPDAEEDINPEMVLLCPKCANSTHVGDFIKTASGIFKSKVATCLDSDFKAIRRLLPKKGDKIELSSGDVSAIHKKLDKIYDTYRKFEKALDK